MNPKSGASANFATPAMRFLDFRFPICDCKWSGAAWRADQPADGDSVFSFGGVFAGRVDVDAPAVAGFVAATAALAAAALAAASAAAFFFASAAAAASARPLSTEAASTG